MATVALAVIVPEVVMTQGQLIGSCQDARLFGAAAGAAPFSLLPPLVVSEGGSVVGVWAQAASRDTATATAARDRTPGSVAGTGTDGETMTPAKPSMPATRVRPGSRPRHPEVGSCVRRERTCDPVECRWPP